MEKIGQSDDRVPESHAERNGIDNSADENDNLLMELEEAFGFSPHPDSTSEDREDNEREDDEGDGIVREDNEALANNDSENDDVNEADEDHAAIEDGFNSDSESGASSLNDSDNEADGEPRGLNFIGGDTGPVQLDWRKHYVLGGVPCNYEPPFAHRTNVFPSIRMDRGGRIVLRRDKYEHLCRRTTEPRPDLLSDYESGDEFQMAVERFIEAEEARENDAERVLPPENFFNSIVDSLLSVVRNDPTVLRAINSFQIVKKLRTKMFYLQIRGLETMRRIRKCDGQLYKEAGVEITSVLTANMQVDFKTTLKNKSTVTGMGTFLIRNFVIRMKILFNQREINLTEFKIAILRDFHLYLSGTKGVTLQNCPVGLGLRVLNKYNKEIIDTIENYSFAPLRSLFIRQKLNTLENLHEE